MEDRTEQKAALAKRLRGMARATTDGHPNMNSEAQGVLELAADLLEAPPASRESSYEIAPDKMSTLVQESPGRILVEFQVGEEALRLLRPPKLTMLIGGITWIEGALSSGMSYSIADRVIAYRDDALEHVSTHGCAQSDPVPTTAEADAAAEVAAE